MQFSDYTIENHFSIAIMNIKANQQNVSHHE
jgi:hypothetical protein